MRKKAFGFLALILSVFVMSSCMSVKPLAISDISSVKVSGINGASLVVQATFKIKNPNSFGFTVKASDLDLMLNNSLVGKAALVEKIVVPRKSDQEYTVNVEANLAQLLFSGLANMAALSKTSNAKVRLKGDLKVSKYGLIRKKFPVDMEKSINLGKLQ